jgi:HSP20 family protein
MTLMTHPTKQIDRPISAFRRGLEKAFNRTYNAFERNPLSIFRDLPSWPAIDVAEDEKNLTLRIDVPGLKPADIDVEVSGNLLTIRGQREEADWKDPRRPGRDNYRHERFFGSFSRTLTLPEYVDAEKIDARYDKGVLVLNVPKVPGAGPKRIPVKSA